MLTVLEKTSLVYLCLSPQIVDSDAKQTALSSAEDSEAENTHLSILGGWEKQ